MPTMPSATTTKHKLHPAHPLPFVSNFMATPGWKQETVVVRFTCLTGQLTRSEDLVWPQGGPPMLNESDPHSFYRLSL